MKIHENFKLYWSESLVKEIEWKVKFYATLLNFKRICSSGDQSNNFPKSSENIQALMEAPGSLLCSHPKKVCALNYALKNEYIVSLSSKLYTHSLEIILSVGEKFFCVKMT